MGAVVRLRPIHGNAILDGRRQFDIFPVSRRHHRPGCCWMYAVGFTNGRIKLGISSRPRKRILQYWTESGGAIQWAHLFGNFGSRAQHVERCAVQLAAAISRQDGRSESFTGLTREQALHCVREAARLKA